MQRNDITTLCDLGKEAQALSRLYSFAPVTAQELEQWFSSVDFEALPPEVSCMAAATAARNGFAGVPAAFAPRLRGIIKYVHTLNAGMLSGVCTLGEALNHAQLPVLLLDDTALYLSGEDASERHLWQVRIGVRKQDYVHALDIARQAGWDVEVFPYTAVARQNATRQVTVIPVEDTSYLWCNTSALKKGNAVFLCPEIAAILVGINQNAFRALTRPTPRAAIIRWSMDMKRLSARLTLADWHRAAELARNEHVCSHMHLLFMVYAALSGNPCVHKDLFGTQEDAEHLLKLLTAFLSCRHRVRRLYLLCRLRRPDSILYAIKLFLRQVLRKLGL